MSENMYRFDDDRPSPSEARSMLDSVRKSARETFGDFFGLLALGCALSHRAGFTEEAEALAEAAEALEALADRLADRLADIARAERAEMFGEE